MGQPIEVTVREGLDPRVMHFELNRGLTGMEIVRYASTDGIRRHGPAERLARQLFGLGVTGVTIYSNHVTVSAGGERWEELLPQVLAKMEALFVHYRNGSTTPGTTASDPALGEGRVGTAGQRVPAWQPGEVVDVIVETPETTTLRLRLTDPHAFLPGQYYNVRMPIAGRPRPVQRSYSIGSSPHPRPGLVDLTVKEMEGGLVSPVLVRDTPVGAHLEVRGPYGRFTWTDDQGGPVALIGAGSGVVPLMCIIRYAAARGLSVPMDLLFSSKSFDFVIYRQELGELASRHQWFTVAHTFTRAPEDPRPRYHQRIGPEIIDDWFHTTGAPHMAYICGPPQMVDASVEALVGLGVAEERIKTEKYD